MGRRPNHDDGFIPIHMRGLRRDSKGRPQPFFARNNIENEADGRLFVDAHIVDHCRMCRLCWFCGLTIKPHDNVAFMLSSRSALTRVSLAPPQHIDCALYAARVYPSTLVRTNAHVFEVIPNHEFTYVWVTNKWRVLDQGDCAPWFMLGRVKRKIFFHNGQEHEGSVLWEFSSERTSEGSGTA